MHRHAMPTRMRFKAAYVKPIIRNMSMSRSPELITSLTAGSFYARLSASERLVNLANGSFQKSGHPSCGY